MVNAHGELGINADVETGSGSEDGSSEINSRLELADLRLATRAKVASARARRREVEAQV